MHTLNFQPTGKRDYRTGREVLKPSAVLEYNKNMGGVDKADMLLSSVGSVRKTVKWYKKLFFHILDMAILNSHSLYQTNSGKIVSLADFQLKLITQILEKYVDRTNNKRHAAPVSYTHLDVYKRQLPNNPSLQLRLGLVCIITKLYTLSQFGDRLSLYKFMI